MVIYSDWDVKNLLLKVFLVMVVVGLEVAL